MARSFNQVVLMGNLTRDPELRNTPTGQSVCNFSLALNRSYKSADGEWQEATDFIDVVAWGALGERVAQYLTKGRPALVSGRLQSRSWEQEGAKRSKVEVVAQDVTFLGGSGGAGASADNMADEPAAKQPASAKASAGKKADQEDDIVIEDLDSDEKINLDEIPF